MADEVTLALAQWYHDQIMPVAVLSWCAASLQRNRSDRWQVVVHRGRAPLLIVSFYPDYARIVGLMPLECQFEYADPHGMQRLLNQSRDILRRRGGDCHG